LATFRLNFAAKRLVDMRYVSGLDLATAERHFRWRPAVPPGGLGFRAGPVAVSNETDHPMDLLALNQAIAAAIAAWA
jgi:hypothetical protein